MDNVKSVINKASKKSQQKNKISFDEEIVPLNAQQPLTNTNEQLAQSTSNKTKEKHKKKVKEQKINLDDSKTDQMSSLNVVEENVTKLNDQKVTEKKLSRKQKKKETLTETDAQLTNNYAALNEAAQPASITKSKKNKKKANQQEINMEEDTKTDQPDNSTMEEASTTKLEKGEKKESKRSQKRKKHMELIIDKKIKSDIAVQEKNLNYLSKWKHNRADWKFAKHSQLWLKENIFDKEKIPEDFWEILTEYFSNAQGNIRKYIIADALKIIERDDDKEEDSHEDILFSRARSILQCLQE